VKEKKRKIRRKKGRKKESSQQIERYGGRSMEDERMKES